MHRIIVLFILWACLATAHTTSSWLTLPPTPTLPPAKQTGYASINGVRIWYAVFGAGKPVILLHGAFANANYWGYQIPALAKHYQVIVMDSRGQGRSTANTQPYHYSLMASDVIQLLNFLQIKKAAIVGWSDGAIIGLDIAIHHPDRVTKLFAFGANSNPKGIREDAEYAKLFHIYNARVKKEYTQLSPTPNQFNLRVKQLTEMMATEPNFTREQLHSIKIPVWIVDGDHDEGIKREDTEFMAASIPLAGLLLQPGTSHFSFLQDSTQFNHDVLHFLELNLQ